ncbi:MAG: glycoside hydrolase family 36 protein [Cellulophaga sp.]|uniref:glycoside hydrolase family 36 protein n=1 Tax=Cellulophaga sp. TaxID=1972202 RepID=UPI00326597B7
MIKQTTIISAEDIQIEGNTSNFITTITNLSTQDQVTIFNISINAKEAQIPGPISLKWKIPAHNVKGIWKPTTDFNKRIQADWELQFMESRVSIDAPIISLFGNDDTNTHTFACSNAINMLELNAQIREEDDCFYCFVTLFTERHFPLSEFNMQLRIDARDIHFSDVLKDVSKWWETFDDLQPTSVPEIANAPLYSTWYNFHQNLDEDLLEKECKKASELGYKAIIIDDGWQTNDGNRGYDYTGDWLPERITKTKEFVSKVHATGLKVGFWYSVPFCGKKSKAYKRFKGKFLTENHRWAPVFDPRYPEVRDYLINIYKSALVDWNLDGFKLDFIDDFKFYPETKKEITTDMDYTSVNEAVDRLLLDVISTLKAIKPDVFVEFRQKYTGPAMRKYGNMFRAFDCPGDATMNRIRIADIKMLAGNTAVHSDMITWHNDERLEVAALQLVNTLFGVPQLSVLLKDAPQEFLNMIGFYTKYWNKNKELITTGNFTPFKPLANYPVKQVVNQNKLLLGVFDDYVAQINSKTQYIDILNGKLSTSLIVQNTQDLGTYTGTIYNCEGTVISTKKYALNKGILAVEIPSCGLLRLTQKQ